MEDKNCPTISLSKVQAIIAIIIGAITILTPIIVLATRINFTEAQTNQNTQDIKELRDKFNVVDKKLDTVVDKLQMIIDGKINIKSN